MRRLTAALLAAPLLSVAPLPASAPAVPGVVMEVEVRTQGPNAVPQTTTLRVEGQNIRFQTLDGTGNQPDEMIFRGATREMLLIDHGRRQYIVIDEATLKSLAAQMNDAMSQMDAALANVPPEQRAMIEQMLGGRGMGAAAAAPRAEPELRPTDERAEHSGYPTRRYDVFVDGTRTREFWVTEWGNVEGLEEARTALESMASYMQEMLEALASGPLGRNLAELDQAGFEYLDDMNGFPIVTREFSASGTLQSEATVRSVRQETLSADIFNPPAGYTRQAMGG